MTAYEYLSQGYYLDRQIKYDLPGWSPRPNAKGKNKGGKKV